MSNVIGERIKSKRILLGYSQTELAHKLGYADRSMIAKIEANNVKDLPVSKVQKLCEILDITYDYAIGKDNIYTNGPAFIKDEATHTTAVLDSYGDDFTDKIYAIIKLFDKYKDLMYALEELPKDKQKLVTDLIRSLSDVN